MDESQNPLDAIYDPAPAAAPRPKPKSRRKIPKKKSVMVKRAPKPVPALPTTYRMNLSVRHSINGVVYGPGYVEIEGDLGRLLIEAEQRNRAEERGLFEKRAAIIFPGGRTVSVHPDTFDNPDALSGAPLAFSVAGK